MDDRIALVDLADELKVRKQWLFKIQKRLGIRSAVRREEKRRGQKVATVTRDEALRIKQEVTAAGARARSQDPGSGEDAPALRSGDEVGFFYVIQLEPDHDQHRFKVGFTLDLEARLRKHRTSAPFARYAKTWPCRRTWERAAIDCATVASEQLRSEVFRAGSLQTVLQRADQLFAIMPTLRAEVGRLTSA